MKNLRKVLFTTLILVILLCIISVIAGYTLVIPISKSKQLDSPALVKGDTIDLLEGVDLTKGSWKAYINLSRSDFENLSPSIKKATCLTTSDIQVIEKMKTEWRFIYTGADIATVESTIYVFQNDELVLESGIVLDKNKQGLQNSTYGWIETTQPGILAETFKNFKKVYWPIIFL